MPESIPVEIYTLPASSHSDTDKSRPRLLSRLLQQDAAALSDAELLEILLAPIAVNSHELAVRLLECFTTLANVLYAEERDIRNIQHINDGVIQTFRCVRALGERVLRNEIAERPLIDCWSKLIEYCILTMAQEKVETFRVLFMNHAHMLLADEVQHRGTVNHTPGYPREVVKRALELSAAAVILVHNHPSGDATPSPADIEMTQKIVTAATTMGITVHDHIIISEKGHYSFRTVGLLEDSPKKSPAPQENPTE